MAGYSHNHKSSAYDLSSSLIILMIFLFARADFIDLAALAITLSKCIIPVAIFYNPDAIALIAWILISNEVLFVFSSVISMIGYLAIPCFILKLLLFLDEKPSLLFLTFTGVDHQILGDESGDSALLKKSFPIPPELKQTAILMSCPNSHSGVVSASTPTIQTLDFGEIFGQHLFPGHPAYKERQHINWANSTLACLDYKVFKLADFNIGSLDDDTVSEIPKKRSTVTKRHTEFKLKRGESQKGTIHPLNKYCQTKQIPLHSVLTTLPSPMNRDPLEVVTYTDSMTKVKCLLKPEPTLNKTNIISGILESNQSVGSQHPKNENRAPGS